MARKGIPLALSVALFSLIMLATVVAGTRLAGLPWSPAYALEVVFFAVVSYLLLTWQEHAMVGDPKGFVRRFMTALVMKMFGCLIVVVCLVFLAPRDVAVPWILCFAMLYLAFLAYSVARLMRRSKQPHGTPETR